MRMKYELTDDEVEFICAAIDTHVAAAMAKAGGEIASLAAKKPSPDKAGEWLQGIEDTLLQEKGYVDRRDSVFEALRKPIK